jgi:hypothetical protein
LMWEKSTAGWLAPSQPNEATYSKAVSHFMNCYCLTCLSWPITRSFKSVIVAQPKLNVGLHQAQPVQPLELHNI